jgi:hypothetical protein
MRREEAMPPLGTHVWPHRPAVATVLSPREWEPRLAEEIRDTGTVRLVARAADPDDVVDRIDEIEVVVVGAETPWLSSWLVGAWRRLGLIVVGVHEEPDQPARRLFVTGGADEIVSERLEPSELLRTIRAAAL